MKNKKIFQIYYDEESKSQLDPGFTPLENTENIRSDWREYWPIRSYLLNNPLDEDGLYGFLSPRFKLKTGLSSVDCYKFIEDSDNGIEVFSFSPFFDIGAWYQNSFLQAIQKHSNSRDIVEKAVAILDPSINLHKLVMHSGNIIFCNYFVAKPIFWRAWLLKCEKIFSQAEIGIGPLSLGLNTNADDHHSNAPIKTFIIERVASLILATTSTWKVKIYNPLSLPLAPTLISREISVLLQMDALEIAHVQTGRDEYLSLFINLRNLVSENINNQKN